jgi:4-hydroxybenzoate polyprenyltransferase
VSNSIDRKGFAVLFILIAALLYFYATTLKQIALLGNIVVAAILSFSIIIIGFFDLTPALIEGNGPQLKAAFSVLIDYALFAFVINFIRELVKDIEDVEADKATGIATLPVIFGKEKTLKLIPFLSIIPIIFILIYINKRLVTYDYALYYALLFILGPLLLFTLKSITAKTQKEIKNLSTLLKIILLFGILSIAVLTYTVPLYA